jgi:outer membrane biosynthesis protein TonB
VRPKKAPQGKKPAREAPAVASQPIEPDNTNPVIGAPVQSDPVPDVEMRQPEFAPAVVRGSRWLDYDTHELLQLISDLEDERRWARFREGIWLAILFHLALLSAVTWIPKYVFNVPQVIDPIDAIKQRKDLTYLDMPPDALRELPPKVVVKPVPEKPPVIDKQTLEEMNKPAPPPPVPEPTLQPPPEPVQPQPNPQFEAPRPLAVPARPNFAMNSLNPADQLREDMMGASRNPGQGAGNLPSDGEMTRHPGAGAGGVQILSDTQGVDFNSWLQRWHHETERTWDPLIPDEVNPPINRAGVVVIRFKVLPNGRLMEGGMVLEGRSGDVALDRAAWGALVGSNYPPLPKGFHGPYLELRASFWYNVEPPR